MRNKLVPRSVFEEIISVCRPVEVGKVCCSLVRSRFTTYTTHTGKKKHE